MPHLDLSVWQSSAVARLPGARDRRDSAVPSNTLSSSPNRSIRVPCIVFLISRALMLVLAWAAPHLIPTARTDVRLLPRTDPLAAIWGWSSPWFRFDTRWYVGVAEHGYHWGGLNHANTNFLPLYPLLIRAVQPLTLNSPWLAGFLIANAAFLWALIALWRWSLLRWDRRVAFRILVLVSLFPFAMFFVTPYAESLFLALALTALLLAEQDRWALAACAGGLSAVSRPVGMAVVLALVVIAVQRRNRTALACALASAIPFLAFVGYLTIAFGHPFAFLTYHSAGWVPPSGGPVHTVLSQFHTHLSPFDRVDALAALVFLSSAVAAWRRIGPAYGVYTLVGVILPLVHGLVSMERYVVVLFPAMAVWSTARSKLAHMAVLAISLMLLVMATTMFATGYALF